MQHWFLAIVPVSPRGMLGFALGAASALAGSFCYMLGAFDEHSPDRAEALGLGLFFGTFVAFSTTAAAWIVRRSATAMRSLHVALDCDDADAQAQAERLAGSLTSVPPGRAASYAAIGLALGVLHYLSLVAAGLAGLPITLADVAGLAGTLITWVVVTYLVAVFVGNAGTLAAVGRELVRIDLLKPQALHPFGLMAALPLVGLIATQTLYPLLSLRSGGFNPYTTLPGFVVTLASLTYLFCRATWPLHRRLVAAKREAIAAVQARIDATPRDDLAALQPLLGHREYLERVPEWPFSVSLVARWTLYVLIPPLTWVGAALIERAVDAFIEL